MKVRVQPQIIFAIFSSATVGIVIFETGHTHDTSVGIYKHPSRQNNLDISDQTNLVTGMNLKRILIQCSSSLPPTGSVLAA